MRAVYKTNKRAGGRGVQRPLNDGRVAVWREATLPCDHELDAPANKRLKLQFDPSLVIPFDANTWTCGESSGHTAGRYSYLNGNMSISSSDCLSALMPAGGYHVQQKQPKPSLITSSSSESSQVEKDGTVRNEKLEDRNETFREWKGPVDYQSMAEAGFVYTGQEDLVSCFSCNIKLDGWTKHMDPLLRHKEKSPTCSFVRQKLLAVKGGSISLADQSPTGQAAHHNSITSAPKPATRKLYIEPVSSTKGDLSSSKQVAGTLKPHPTISTGPFTSDNSTVEGSSLLPDLTLIIPSRLPSSQTCCHTDVFHSSESQNGDRSKRLLETEQFKFEGGHQATDDDDDITIDGCHGIRHCLPEADN